jgi:hypothetical protein
VIRKVPVIPHSLLENKILRSLNANSNNPGGILPSPIRYKEERQESLFQDLFDSRDKKEEDKGNPKN